MKRIVTFITFGTIFVRGAAAQTPTPSTAAEDFSNIQNFLCVTEGICTGGQPSMENLEKMKAQGVRSVVNLRRANEYNFEEEAATSKNLDLRYFHIPVDKNNLKDEQVEEFLKVTGDPQNRPIFIHCTSANRVGTFWMIRRVLFDKWKVEDAEAEARKVGMHDDNLRDWALDYIKRHRATDNKK